MARPGVFVDRDGTISEEVGYINHLDRFRPIPSSLVAIRRLNDAGLPCFLATNQAGVARGYFGVEMVEKVHERLRLALAEAGAGLEEYYACLHHPREGDPPFREDCQCRKPRTGMLDRAKEEHGIDLRKSVMVGDSRKDIELAKRAQAYSVLVLTGYGKGTLEAIQRKGGLMPDLVAPNLAGSVDWILEKLLHVGAETREP